MKPRIFISMHYLELGGAETSLIGMLQSIDYSRFDVDLFLYAHRGELLPFVPAEVRLLPEVPAYAHIESPLRSALVHGQWGVALGRLWAKWLTWLRRRLAGGAASAAELQYVADSVAPFLPSLHHLGCYDLAVSYVTPHNVVRDKVLARRKVCWIHTDYSVVRVDAARELPVWDSFDRVVSISPDVTRTFLEVFPSLRPKVVEMENILSPEFVRRRAAEFDATAELAKWGG